MASWVDWLDVAWSGEARGMPHRRAVLVASWAVGSGKREWTSMTCEGACMFVCVFWFATTSLRAFFLCGQIFYIAAWLRLLSLIAGRLDGWTAGLLHEPRCHGINSPCELRLASFRLTTRSSFHWCARAWIALWYTKD